MKLGGTERHVIALASGLQALGHRVKILTLFFPGQLAGEVEKKGIPFECLQLPYRWGAKTFFALHQWFGKNPVRMAHTYLFGFDLFAAWPARLRKVPVVISSRREIPEWQKARHRMLVRMGNRFVDRVICCSNAVRAWTLEHERLPSEKVCVIYNGVETGHFFPAKEAGEGVRREFGIPQNVCVAGTVANFGAEKGYAYLIKAAGRALERDPSLRFLFVGDGPLKPAIEREAKKISPENHIIFTGFRPDIPPLLNAMDILVQASTVEGMPNSVYEAMACGKPVIATRVGGVPEILEQDKEGLLVEPRDEAALAGAILRLAGDSALRARLGASARRKIETSFSMQSMIDQYEELYAQLL